MNKKFLLIMLFLAAAAGEFDTNAQSVVIKTKDGTETVKNLNSLRKFTFSDDNMLWNYYSGSTESYSVSTISKIFFNSGNTGSDYIATDKSAGIISVYPNPVREKIYFLNAPAEGAKVMIFKADGTMVLREWISSGVNFINAGNLRNGLYLLKVDSQVIKFIKQ